MCESRESTSSHLNPAKTTLFDSDVSLKTANRNWESTELILLFVNGSNLQRKNLETLQNLQLSNRILATLQRLIKVHSCVLINVQLPL